jgi:hypothetical protein
VSLLIAFLGSKTCSYSSNPFPAKALSESVAYMGTVPFLYFELRCKNRIENSEN